MDRIGFIGIGNMGGAIARAVAKKLPASGMYLANRTPEKAEQLAAELGARFSTNEEIFGLCDMIFIGVKPQGIDVILEEGRELIAKRSEKPTIVTMAAGIRTEDFILAFPGCKVIRIMPNTPVGIGKGVVLFSPRGTSEEEENEFISMMSEAGTVIRLDESLMDAGCALSGCGPAFVYMFADALAKGGEKAGLEYDTALLLAAKTLIGSAEMILASGKSPEELKNAVCSPGGSTLRGVEVFEEKGLDPMTQKAVIAAFKRSVELGNR